MEQETIWIIAIVALLLGALIGFLMGRTGSGQSQRKKIEEELQCSKAEMDTYKNEVTSHFEQTAALVNELTEQYRKVHQHLATGAQSLCADQQAGESLQLSLQPKLEGSTQEELTPEADSDLHNQDHQAESSETSIENEQSLASNQEQQPDASSADDIKNDVEAPKDWAPKSPDDEGTLSDRYGLKKKTEDSPNPPHPDPGLNEDEPEQNGAQKKN